MKATVKAPKQSSAKTNSLKKKILLLEDDQSLGETLCERLGDCGYEIVWASTKKQATQEIESRGFDLLVLDVGLPDGSGYDFARLVKQKMATPFLFLTAQSDANERLAGYEIGASDYIPKPFVFKELLLRIQRIFRGNLDPVKTIICADRVINLHEMSVSDNEEKITYLSNRDFRLLNILIRQSPRPVSRDQILDELLGLDQFPSSRTIDNSIVRLRQILGKNAGKSIRSIRGVGYQWLAPKKLDRET